MDFFLIPKHIPSLGGSVFRLFLFFPPFTNCKNNFEVTFCLHVRQERQVNLSSHDPTGQHVDGRLIHLTKIWETSTFKQFVLKCELP